MDQGKEERRRYQPISGPAGLLIPPEKRTAGTCVGERMNTFDRPEGFTAASPMLFLSLLILHR